MLGELLSLAIVGAGAYLNIKEEAKNTKSKKSEKAWDDMDFSEKQEKIMETMGKKVDQQVEKQRRALKKQMIEWDDSDVIQALSNDDLSDWKRSIVEEEAERRGL
jgi:polyribonucleotide nucleotidyltransferase